MSISCKHFGYTKDGKEVLAFQIMNDSGAYVTVLNRGGIIQSLCVPDKSGNLVDVVLGFDSVAEYEADPEYLGAVIGRVANRIRDGIFTLGGKRYELAKMENGNCIHGGIDGYSFRMWDHQIDGEKLVLTLHSPDGDEGFPGNLDVTVAFAFDNQNNLRLEYHALPDADTIVNLTSHIYFNLSGEGDILDHMLQIRADEFTAVDERYLPTGEIVPVEGTPFDFRKVKAIGDEIDADDTQIRYGLGYDHNFCLSADENSVYTYSPKTGIALHLSTDFPGLQFYTGNMLPDCKGKGGLHMPVRAGFCLEMQYYPDSPNHDNFPSIVLKAGQEWKHYAVFHFGVNE